MAVSTANTETDVTKLDSPAQMEHLFCELQARRVPLTVALDSSAGAFGSAILEVVAGTKPYIVLDELVPSQGLRRLKKHTLIDIITSLDGVEVAFRAIIDRVGQTNGIPYYRVPFPAFINYSQRRQDFRVPVPLARNLEVAVTFDRDTCKRGEIRDISVGGFCARLQDGALEPRQYAGRTALARIDFDEAKHIITKINASRIDSPAARRVQRLAAQFIGLDAAALRTIESLVAELDRHYRRLR